MTEGPKRLDFTDGKDLGESLAEARGHLPSTDRLATVAQRLAAAGIPVAGPNALNPAPESPAVSPATPSNGLFVKAAIGALATGGVVATLLFALPEGNTPTPASKSPLSAPAPVLTSSPSSVIEPVVPTHTSAPRVPSPSHAAPPAVVEEFATPAPHAEPVAPGPRATPAPRAEKAPEAIRTASPAKTSEPPSKAEASAAFDEPVPAPTAQSTEQNVEANQPSSLPARSEVELLKQARGALASDPERALLLARRHGAEFPFGAYAQEREFIAISALARLSRASEAGARADAFRKRYPRSAYLPQLERLLGAR
jgi:hypothetical protein